MWISLTISSKYIAAICQIVDGGLAGRAYVKRGPSTFDRLRVFLPSPDAEEMANALAKTKFE